MNKKSLQPGARLKRAVFLFLAAFAATCAADAVPGAEATAVGGDEWTGKAVAIPVKGVIVGKPLSDLPEQVTAALDRAEREEALLVVLEIDSPGGEVDACDKLAKRIFESKVPAVALVEHKAVSGGAMIAAAANEIVMARAARFGDIQPMRASLVGDAPAMDDRTAEKIEVDVRTIMKVYAENHGRPPAVFAAMVSRDMDLYQVAFDDGRTGYLDGHELQLHEENIEKGREARKIVATKILKPKGKLLELTAQQAVEYGVASEAVDSPEAFYRSRGFDAADIVRAKIEEGQIDLTKLLPSMNDIGLPPWVLALLGVFLVAGIAGVVAEFMTPGGGLAAAIGLIGFVAFFSTLFMYDRGGPLGIAVFLVGIGLLIVEIMVLPGFGVAGVLGISGILLGLFLAFTPDWNSEYMKAFMWQEVGSFAILLIAVLVGLGMFFWIVSEYGDRIPFLRYFMLKRDEVGGEAPAVHDSAYAEAGDSAGREAARLAGSAGTAETVLRPAGKMRLDSGKIVDVVTDGVYIEAGTRLRVLEAVPGRIVVGPE
ncbi:MAG: ATP-dependent Clp protease proteolytic subunit [Planctomycetota bacterium]|nr:ATP-dependent Clp protease proteolytic subunit [Planctomycetota bacterium]